MRAIIVAAGLGTRFLPATKSIPKEMMPIVDRPIIQYLVEECVTSGIKEIIMIISPGKGAIKDYFTRDLKLEKYLFKAKKFEIFDRIKNLHKLVKFRWAYQRKPLGNGHAILCVSKFIKRNEPTAILFGDDIVDSRVPCLKQLTPVFKKYKKPVMALERVPWADVSKYGVVKAKRVKNRIYKIEAIVEKPLRAEAPSNLTVVGKYILTPKAWEYLKRTNPGHKGEIGIANTFRDMVAAGEEVYGYEFQGKRFDCGGKLGYLRAQIHFGLKDPQAKRDFYRYLKGSI